MEKEQLVELGKQILQGKKRTHAVQIDLRDINPEYIGTFVFHHPSLMEQIQIGVIKSRMLEGVPIDSVDPVTNSIALMTATLQVVLDSAPDWFNLDELDDIDVLTRVFREYADWEASFRKPNTENNNQKNS